MPAHRVTDLHVDLLTQQLLSVATGDTEAFTQVYDGVAHRVYGIALRVIGDSHQAEEVAQETLIEVWRNAARFDATRGSASAWISTMAHHRAVDRVRSSSSSRRRDTTWHGQRADPSLSDTTYGSVDSRAKTSTILSALTGLPAAQRRAVELAYFGGHTYADVARLMQAPLGTTKTRIRTALHLLRESLDSSMVEPA